MVRIRAVTALSVLILAACGSSGGAAPGTGSRTGSWTPTGVGSTVDVRIAQGATATARVGQLLHFEQLPGLVTSPQPADLDRLTWYGDPRTFLAVSPGAVAVTIPNYDQQFSCPNGGSCAHPNAPLRMTVTITAGSGPRIPAPVHLGATSTVTLAVGQRLIVPSGTQVSVGVTGPDCAVVAGSAIVGVRPGTQQFELVTSAATTTRALTVTVTP